LERHKRENKNTRFWSKVITRGNLSTRHIYHDSYDDNSLSCQPKKKILNSYELDYVKAEVNEIILSSIIGMTEVYTVNL
jgi:hypothetical protein